MSATSYVLTSGAQLTVDLLLNTHADHIRAEDAITRHQQPSGRLGGQAAAVRAEVRRQSALVRAVSITEGFLHRELLQRLELAAPPPRPPFLDVLYGQAEDKALSSWDELTRNFKNLVMQAPTLRSWPNWNQVSALIEARNAIVHGLGRYTPRQRRRDIHVDTTPVLAALGFGLVQEGGVPVSFTIADAGLTASVAVLRDYLYWVDESIYSTGTPPPTGPAVVPAAGGGSTATP